MISGEVLLVSDVYERVYGYRNPLIINHNEEKQKCCQIQKQYEKVYHVDVGHYDDLRFWIDAGLVQ